MPQTSNSKVWQWPAAPFCWFLKFSGQPDATAHQARRSADAAEAQLELCLPLKFRSGCAQHLVFQLNWSQEVNIIKNKELTNSTKKTSLSPKF